MTPKRLLYAIEETFQENGHEVITSFLTHCEKNETINVEMVGNILIEGKLCYEDNFDLKLYKWKFTNCTEEILNLLNKLFKRLYEIDILNEMVSELDQYLSEHNIEVKRIDYNFGIKKTYNIMLFINQKTYILEFIAKRHSNSSILEYPIIDDFECLFIHPWKIVSEGADFLQRIFLKEILNNHKIEKVCQIL